MSPFPRSPLSATPELRKATSTGTVTESIGKMGVHTNATFKSSSSASAVVGGGNSGTTTGGMKSPKRKIANGGMDGGRKLSPRSNGHGRGVGNGGQSEHNVNGSTQLLMQQGGEESDTTTHESDEEKESKERAEWGEVGGRENGKASGIIKQERQKQGRFSKRNKGGFVEGSKLCVDTTGVEGESNDDGVTPVSGFLEGGFKRIEIKR